MAVDDMSMETDNQLSRLEKEYLSHMVNGLSSAAIAEELDLSFAGAAAVRKSLETKFGVTSAAALVSKGILAGL